MTVHFSRFQFTRLFFTVGAHIAGLVLFDALFIFKHCFVAMQSRHVFSPVHCPVSRDGWCACPSGWKTIRNYRSGNAFWALHARLCLNSVSSQCAFISGTRVEPFLKWEKDWMPRFNLRSLQWRERFTLMRKHLRGNSSYNEFSCAFLCPVFNFFIFTIFLLGC